MNIKKSAKAASLSLCVAFAAVGGTAGGVYAADAPLRGPSRDSVFRVTLDNVPEKPSGSFRHASNRGGSYEVTPESVGINTHLGSQTYYAPREEKKERDDDSPIVKKAKGMEDRFRNLLVIQSPRTCIKAELKPTTKRIGVRIEIPFLGGIPRKNGECPDF